MPGKINLMRTLSKFNWSDIFSNRKIKFKARSLMRKKSIKVSKRVIKTAANNKMAILKSSRRLPKDESV